MVKSKIFVLLFFTIITFSIHKDKYIYGIGTIIYCGIENDSFILRDKESKKHYFKYPINSEQAEQLVKIKIYGKEFKVLFVNKYNLILEKNELDWLLNPVLRKL